MADHIQINDVTPRVIYTADGVQTAFTFPFAIFKAADLEVWLDTVKQVSGFTISGAGATSGGNVTFAAAPGAGVKVTLRRQLGLARTSDYQADGVIRAKTLNDELDYQVAAIQQVAEQASRAIARPVTSASTAALTLPDPVAGKAIGWNADATGLTNDPADFAATVTSVTAQAGIATSKAAEAATASSSSQFYRDQAATYAAAAAASAEAAAAAGGGDLLAVNNLNDLADASTARVNLGLGSAAMKNTGTSAGNVVELDGAARLPAVDGSQLTGIGNGGGQETITAGEDLATGDAIYLDDGNLRGAGAGRWYKIDTDATGPVRIGRVRGVALAAITAGNTGTAQVGPGVVTVLTDLTAGQLVYASGGAGAMTQTEPAVPISGTQNAVVIMGRALDTTTMQFEPWHDVVFQAREALLAVDGHMTMVHWLDAAALTRVVRAYIAAPGDDIRVTTATPTMPKGGTAMNINDNNPATTATTGSIGNLGGLPVASRILLKLDLGNSQTITKVEAVSLVLSAGASLPTGWSFYTSSDDATWSVYGAGFTVNTSASSPSRTGSATCRYIGLVADSSDYGSITLTISDMNVYAPGATRFEPVDVGSYSIDAAAATKVTVKFSDAVNANQETNTTFYNRTGATRDLIFEVVL